MEKITCLECRKHFSKNFFTKHLEKEHGLTKKEYSIKNNLDWIYKEIVIDKGKCKECGEFFAVDSIIQKDNQQFAFMRSIKGCDCGRINNSKKQNLCLYGNLNNYTSPFEGRFTEKWFKEKYGNEWEEEHKKKHQKTAGTLENFIRRHGDHKGKEKYKEFCKKCDNKSLKYFIQRFGEERGRNEYEKSCNIQQKTSPRGIFYWIEKGYSEIEAKKLKKDFNSRGSNINYLKKKYGNEEGEKRYYESMKRRIQSNNIFSKTSKQCFEKIINILCIDKNSCYFAENEYFISSKNYFFSVDFYNKDLNLWIEFNGDFWHANPEIYKKDDFIGYPINKFANDLWKKDNDRIEKISNHLKTSPIIIWERKWNRNPEKYISIIKEKIIENFKN